MFRHQYQSAFTFMKRDITGIRFQKWLWRPSLKRPYLDNFPKADFGKLFFLESTHIDELKSVEKPFEVIFLKLHQKWAFIYWTSKETWEQMLTKQSFYVHFLVAELFSMRVLRKIPLYGL